MYDYIKTSSSSLTGKIELDTVKAKSVIVISIEVK